MLFQKVTPVKGDVTHAKAKIFKRLTKLLFSDLHDTFLCNRSTYKEEQNKIQKTGFTTILINNLDGLLILITKGTQKTPLPNQFSLITYLNVTVSPQNFLKNFHAYYQS